MNDSSPPHHLPIRSFVLRAGRMGSGQARALAELGPRFVLPFAAAPQDWDAHFGRQAPKVLEIGFGMGDATAAVALAQPQTDFIGIEVHRPGVGALLKLIGERQLCNLRIVQHDAVAVLQQNVSANAVIMALRIVTLSFSQVTLTPAAAAASSSSEIASSA